MAMFRKFFGCPGKRIKIPGDKKRGRSLTPGVMVAFVMDSKSDVDRWILPGYRAPALAKPKIMPAPSRWPKLAVANNSGTPKFFQRPGWLMGRAGPNPDFLMAKRPTTKANKLQRIITSATLGPQETVLAVAKIKECVISKPVIKFKKTTPRNPDLLRRTRRSRGRKLIKIIKTAFPKTRFCLNT